MTRLSTLILVGILALLPMGCSSSKDTGTGPTLTSTDSGGDDNSGGIGADPGSEKDFMLNAGRRVFFKQNSAELDETSRVTLDKQADWLVRYPNWKVKLQGFADDPGSDAQQKTLSQKRADAARTYLVSRGVAAERLYAKGYGRERLVGDCADIECRAQNRRVITNLQDESAAVN
jgi:peptidoglycan-associated lipoprotein